jgi:1,4-alpha-glucan branching enzyme
MAEYLDDEKRRSEEILYKTYANAVWQDRSLWPSREVAHHEDGALSAYGRALGAADFPEVVIHNGTDRLEKSPVQYIENHDHERLICSYGVHARDDVLLQEGDRSQWFKIQPHLIGLLTSKGIPLLWMGEEIGENYFVPSQGFGRVMLLRPVRWDYFYDPAGRHLIDLVRKLIRLRRSNPQFTAGHYEFHDDEQRYQSKDLLLFSRWLPDGAYSLVALNFSDSDHTIEFSFPHSGDYKEELHGEAPLQGVVGGNSTSIAIPSNYGRIWTR